MYSSVVFCNEQLTVKQVKWLSVITLLTNHYSSGFKYVICVIFFNLVSLAKHFEIICSRFRPNKDLKKWSWNKQKQNPPNPKNKHVNTGNNWPANGKVIPDDSLRAPGVLHIHCDGGWVRHVSQPTLMRRYRFSDIETFFNIWCSDINV